MSLNQQSQEEPSRDASPDHSTMSELEALLSAEFNEPSSSDSGCKADTDTKTLTELSGSELTATETPKKLPVITTVIGAPVKRIVSKRPRELEDQDEKETEQGMCLKMRCVSFRKKDPNDTAGPG